MKKRILTILFALIAEIAIIIAVCAIQGVFSKSLPKQELIRFICDGFFVAGVVYVGFGGLVLASGKGVFDGIGYSVSTWFRSFTGNKRDWRRTETYYDYVERKAEKKKGRKVNQFFIFGGITLIVAVILYLVYKFAF